MSFSLRVLAAMAPALATLALARAQSTEYRMDESGRWVQVATAGAADSPGAADAAVIAQARRDLAEERYSAAKSAMDDWIKANERSSSPYLPQAYLIRGDALTSLGYEYDALYDYEAICKQFPQTEEYVKAVDRELEIGRRYVNGYKRKFWFARLLGAEDIGEELLIRVQERLPSSRVAERAGIELADYYFRTGDMEMASEAYKLFLENYPRSAYTVTAMQRRIYATISRFKGPRYDNTPLIDASVLVRKFSSLYPAQAQSAGLDEVLLARLDESAAAGMMETARWYLRVDDPVSARYTLKRLVAKHPRTSAASSALRMMSENNWLESAPPSPIAPEPSAPTSAPASATAPAPARPAAPVDPDRGRFVPGRRLTPTPSGGSTGAPPPPPPPAPPPQPTPPPESRP